MAITMNNPALAEAFGPNEGTALRIKQAALVVLGIAMLAVAAKIKVPMFPSPVPITLGSFAVLTIGASYGPRLGLVTILGYMLVGLLGFDIFASSSAEMNGIEYMMGGTGGYLVGYILAVAYLGWVSRRGLDRSFEGMGGAMLLATAIIYVPGVLWLHQFTTGLEQTMEWGLTPYIIGDLMKLALAVLLIPTIWKLVGKARS